MRIGKVQELWIKNTIAERLGASPAKIMEIEELNKGLVGRKA